MRYETGRHDAAGMVSRVFDPDLLDFVYWMHRVRGMSENTIRVRMDFLHRFAFFVDMPLRSVEPAQVLRFERYAIAGRSPESRKAYCCHLRAFYRWAKTTGIVEYDPTDVLTVPIVPRRLPRPIDEEGLALVLAAARPKMAAMITLGAYAGLRTCEIAGLDWADVHRDADGHMFLHVRNAKGNRERRVEVGEVVLRALQRYGLKRRGPMFLGQDGAPIQARSVSRSINRFLADNGVQATAHQLRHRYGTAAYQVSRDLRMVQEQLGHASPNTTAGYTRPSAEAAARMVAALDALALPDPRDARDPGDARSPRAAAG